MWPPQALALTYGPSCICVGLDPHGAWVVLRRPACHMDHDGFKRIRCQLAVASEERWRDTPRRGAQAVAVSLPSEQSELPHVLAGRHHQRTQCEQAGLADGA